jgi:hypothetical protein
MQFVLTTFTQESGFRVFAFEGIDSERIRTTYTVRVDLALTRIYGIRMQELPLLCRGLLERGDTAGSAHSLTFTEEEMGIYSKNCATAKAAAAQKRKPPRRPPSENTGSAWRVPTLP